MNPVIVETISKIKKKYEPEGFIILGIFGSYARNEESGESDIDILYELSPAALSNYPGFRFIELFEKVKQDLETSLSLAVDLADRSALNEIGRKYILPEVRYVA